MRTRKPKTIEVEVRSKEQKKLFFELAKSWSVNKPIIVRYNHISISYALDFEYSTNLKGFLEEYKSIYTRYRFMIVSIQDRVGEKKDKFVKAFEKETGYERNVSQSKAANKVLGKNRAKRISR